MSKPLELDVDAAIEKVRRLSYKYKDMRNLLSLEDMQQEGFIGYMQGHATFDEKRHMSYKNWVMQNVIWAICQAITNERKQKMFNTDDDGYASYIESDLGIQLDDVRQELTPQEQKVIEMRFWEGKTQEECAVYFGVVQRTVGKWEAVALEKMRIMLSEPGQKRADLMPDKGGRWFRDT